MVPAAHSCMCAEPVGVGGSMRRQGRSVGALYRSECAPTSVCSPAQHDVSQRSKRVAVAVSVALAVLWHEHGPTTLYNPKVESPMRSHHLLGHIAAVPAAVSMMVFCGVEAGACCLYCNRYWWRVCHVRACVRACGGMYGAGSEPLRLTGGQHHQARSTGTSGPTAK